MRRGLLIFFLFILIIILSLPFLDGLIFKWNFTKLVNVINTYNRVKVDILEYHLGWMHSSAKLRISPIEQTRPTNQATPEIKTSISVVMDEKITHGPVIYNTTNHSFALGYGSIASNVHLPEALEAIIFGANQPEGMLQVQTLATFHDKWKNHFKVSPINNDTFGKVKWGGLEGNVNFTIRQDKISAIRSHVNIDALSVQAQGLNPFINSIEMKASTYRSHMIYQKTGLWTGGFEYQLPSLAIKQADDSLLSVENFNVINSFGVNDRSLYEMGWKITANTLILPNRVVSAISPLDIRLNFFDLNPQGVMSLPIIMKSLQYNDFTQDKWLQQPLNLITPTSKGVLNVTLNTSLGGFLLNSEVIWPTASVQLHKIGEIIDNANLNANIKVANALVDQFIEVYGAVSPPPVTIQPPTPPIVSSTSRPLEAFNQQVGKLMRDGKISLHLSLQVMDLAHKHLSLDVFNNDIDRLRLSPEVTNLLKEGYQLVLTTINIPEANNVTPANTNRLRQQWDMMINQGYITKVNNEYVSNITVVNKVVKLNGVVIDLNQLMPVTNVSSQPLASPAAPGVQQPTDVNSTNGTLVH